MRQNWVPVKKILCEDSRNWMYYLNVPIHNGGLSHFCRVLVVSTRYGTKLNPGHLRLSLAASLSTNVNLRLLLEASEIHVAGASKNAGAHAIDHCG